MGEQHTHRSTAKTDTLIELLCYCRYVPPYSLADDAILAAYLELLSVSMEAKTVLYSYTSSVLPLHFHCQKGLPILTMMIRVSFHRAVRSAS